MFPSRPSVINFYAVRYAERNMIHGVAVVRPGVPVDVPEDGTVLGVVAETIYSGKARIYPVTGPASYDLGDDQQFFSSSNISIPRFVVDEEGNQHPTTPQIDDLVQVLSHHDPLTIGRWFKVMDVEDGSYMPSVRRMQVSGVQRSSRWSLVPGPHPSAPVEDVPDTLPADWI